MLTAARPSVVMLWGFAVTLAIAVGLGLAFEPVSTAVLLVGLLIIVWLTGIGWGHAGWRLALIGVLLGYIVLSRGFAYTSVDLAHLGAPWRMPIYIGEVVLVMSVLGVRHGSALPGFLRTPGGQWLFVWMAIGLLRTAPQLLTYGTLALRDAAIWYYGLFAYVGYAFAERPRYVWMLLRVLALGFALHLVYSVLYVFHIVDVGAISVVAPGSDFPLLSYRHDASAVNLLGGVLFAFLMGHHLGWPAWVRWLIAVPQCGLFLGLQVRAAYVGGLFAYAVLLYVGQLRQLFRVSVGAMRLVLCVAAIGGEFRIAGQTAQAFSVQRLMDSVASIVDVGGRGRYSNSEAYMSVDNTRWRLDFWTSIVLRNLERLDTTLLGIGFGPDLVSDGRFMVNEDRPNRNPHNITVTLFGRMGLLGLLPWVAFNGLAFAYALRRLRATGWDPLRRDVTGFLLVYAVSMLGAASFGVLLESPFMAIPYYFLLGIAMRLADPIGAHLDVRLAPKTLVKGRRAIAAGVALTFALSLVGAPETSWADVARAGMARSWYVTADNSGNFRTIGEAVKQALSGDRIVVRAGTYRETVIIDKRLELVGEPGATIKGSDVWTGFVREGDVWVVPYPHAWVSHGYCETSSDGRCWLADQVMVDGEPQLQRVSRAVVGPGSFYVGDGKLYLGIDPTGHLVEVSMRDLWIKVAAPDVTVRGFRMTHSRMMGQWGALTDGGQPRVTFAENDLSVAHGAAVRIDGDGTVLRGNRIHHNGQIGVVGHGRNMRIEANVIESNNTEDFQGAWEAGGIKLKQVRNVVLEGNEVFDNRGIGIWCDIDCIDVTFRRNRVHHNLGPGLVYEISFNCLMEENLAWENGHAAAVWAWGAGLLVQNSSGCVVRANVAAWNATSGISVIQQDRGPRWTKMHDNLVHDNVVASQAKYSVALVSDIGTKVEGEGNLAFRNIVFTMSTVELTELLEAVGVPKVPSR